MQKIADMFESFKHFAPTHKNASDGSETMNIHDIYPESGYVYELTIVKRPEPGTQGFTRGTNV